MGRPRKIFPLEAAIEMYEYGASIALISRILHFQRDLVRRRLLEAGVVQGSALMKGNDNDKSIYQYVGSDEASGGSES